MQILRQDLDNHLHDFIQQHLLLLLNDSVENKKRNDELFIENQRLNQQLKETKADLNLFKENAEKTSDYQMINKLLDQCVTDVCNDFNKILMERYNYYSQKGNQIASPNVNNSLLRKFCSFEKILIEAEVHKGIDQFSKELQETILVDDFIEDEILHAYKQDKINSIDFNKIKIILPSSCWKDANEKMKRCVEICCNFEHMKQGMKFDNYIEGKVAASKQRLLEQYRSVLQQGNKCLYLDGYNYYQITLASLPVRRIINNTNGDDIDVKITVSPQDNVVSLSFKANANRRYTSVNPLLVDGTGQQELRLKCVAQHREYICKQSINELKDIGYIINDGFVLRVH